MNQTVLDIPSLSLPIILTQWDLMNQTVLNNTSLSLLMCFQREET